MYLWLLPQFSQGYACTLCLGDFCSALLPCAHACWLVQGLQSCLLAATGFATMSGSQTSMLEDVNRGAGRDEAALNQVQQTAAKGEAHVQGEPCALPCRDSGLV